MSINVRPQLIDQLKIRDHTYLSLTDKCLFFAEFYAGKGFAGDGNQLITNLKSKPSETRRKQYKDKAIEYCANLIIDGFGFELLEKCLFVPIPPSKIKNDPEYDDRLVRILKLIQEKGRKQNFYIQYSELLSSLKNREQMSRKEDRLKPDEIFKNLQLNKFLLEDKSFEAIAIFDDVLVTGSQFKAAQKLIKSNFIDTPIIGIFIARRVLLNRPSEPSRVF